MAFTFFCPNVLIIECDGCISIFNSAHLCITVLDASLRESIIVTFAPLFANSKADKYA